MSAASDPSWGPVGSLLRQLDPQRYRDVLRLHNDMLALERSRQTDKRDTSDKRDTPRPAVQLPPTPVHL